MKIQTRKLSQEKAFLKFLEIVKDDIWIKLGHKSFLKGIRKNQEISLYKTHKKNNDPRTRTIGAKINQPYKFLREWSNQMGQWCVVHSLLLPKVSIEIRLQFLSTHQRRNGLWNIRRTVAQDRRS